MIATPLYVKEDRGCLREGVRISGKCVDCHIWWSGRPVCIEEIPGGIATLRMERTQMLIQGLHDRGASVETIENTLRVSRRTVFRALEGA